MANRNPVVQGECPRGCGRTLFLGAGGYVTCSWIECPEPDAATKLLARKPLPRVALRIPDEADWPEEPLV